MIKLNLFLFAVLTCLFALTTGIPKCLFCPSNSHCEIRKVYGYKLLALCACDPGYTKFGKICKANCQPRCHSYGICLVVDGKPTCTCRPGYLGDGYNCQQDKCYNHECHHLASCFPNRYISGYTCRCNEGYRGNGRDYCYRDKCFNHKCHQYATCIPNRFVRGYTCRCNSGFLGDGRKNCYPVCSPRCHENAQCKVVDGKPSCVCEPGYIGNGLQCIKECKPWYHKYADCKLVNGKPQCVCKPGYIGDDYHCLRNKCYQHKCDEHATCVPHSLGNGYDCRCIKGYWGKGRECYSQSSCVARCGQYKYGFPCQCNKHCKYYKDCCKDYSYKCTGH